MIAPVTYWPDFLDPIEAAEAFTVLDSDLPWGRHSLPRDEVYFNDDITALYTYGSPGRENTYLPEPEWHPVVAEIRRQLELHLPGGSAPMDVCFLNRYVGPRDRLGWHSDNSSEMDDDRPIVTVSLGAVRDIQFRTIADHMDGVMRIGSPHIETLELGIGSAAIMQPGMQQGWLHQIPKSSKSDVGTRISLTFRGYVNP